MLADYQHIGFDGVPGRSKLHTAIQVRDRHSRQIREMSS
jgi:hypothetical protein